MSVAISFSWNILTITDVVGIILTALDFLGLTQMLENAFGKLRQYCDRYARFKWISAKRNWPPHKHVKAITWEIIDALPGVLFTLGLVVWLSGSYEGLRTFLLGLSPLGIAVTAIGFLIALYVNALFAQHVVARTIYAISWSIEKGFMILGLPPKGVMGSIGLIVSVLSFTLTHMIEFGA